MTKTGKTGGLGFATVGLSFANRSQSLAYHLLSLGVICPIVRLEFAVICYRSPILHCRSPNIHLSFAIVHPSFASRVRQSFANGESFSIVGGLLAKFPVLFACGSLQFLFPLFSAVRFSTMPPKISMFTKHPQKRTDTTPIASQPMKLGYTHMTNLSVSSL